MKRAALKEVLESPAMRQAETMRKLVDRILSEDRETGNESTALWRENSDLVASNARELISQLEELALHGLLESPDPIEVTKLVWLMRTLTEIEVAMRRRVIAKLTSLLDRKVLLPEALYAETLEEPVPEIRVCDEAYMLLRRLVQTAEPLESYYQNVRTFGNLPESERDTEIKKAGEQKIFTNWDEPD